MKKQIVVFLMILLLGAVVILGYLYNPWVQEKVANLTEQDFDQENIYSDLTSLAKRLEQEIMKGSDSFVVYLKDIEIDEINHINEYLDGVFGSGATYEQIGQIGTTYKKVYISVDKTENYYALKAYTDGETIPESALKAKQLYEVIRCIMDECIQEGMSDFEKELALHDYLIRNCKYSQDVSQPAGHDIYRAYGALVNGDAVCNGYAEALQLLFACVGIESQFVVGKADEIDHAWNLVKLDGKWYHLDATWNDSIPDSGQRVIHAYFNVSDEILGQNHDWVKENYPQAFSMDYNFYVYNDYYFRDFNEYQYTAYEKMVTEENPYFEGVMRQYDKDEDKDMQFIFRDNNLYQTVNWKMYGGEGYHVMLLEVE